MTVQTYDIQDLVSTTGTPRRTIYFYVQQGVLPPPEGAGLAARYGEDHLLRLKLIPVLRQQGLRLDEIRARFAQMSTDEMRQTLEAAEPQMRVYQAPPASKTQEPKAIYDLPGRDMPGRGYPGQPVGWGEQRYVHYAFPGGITLVAPENPGPLDRQRLQQLLQAARQIFTGQPVMVDPDHQQPRSSTGENGSQTPEE